MTVRGGEPEDVRVEVAREGEVGVGGEDEVAVVEGAGEDADAHAEDPFATFLLLLEEVARASGASEDIALGLRAVLGETRLASTSLPATAVEALVAGHCLEQSAGGIKRTELLTRTVLAWQGILRGEGEDFGACGPRTLDEWAADVLARCMGTTAIAPVLRRELRKRGVAAFGLVAQAA